jgi:hypothetical protein
VIRKLRIRPSSFGVALVAFGLLLWARLLLLTGHPKMAIAEPAAGHAILVNEKKSEAVEGAAGAVVAPSKGYPAETAGNDATHSSHAGD